MKTQNDNSVKDQTAACDNNMLANRLLKFNLWDIDRQQYFHDVLSLEKDKIVQWGTLEKRTSNNVIWLQFVGLNDKNGKNIFDYDIISCFYKNQQHIKLVRYNENKASFQIANKQSLKNDDSWDIWSDITEKYLKDFPFEVIGNYFQNSELLQSTS